MEKLQITKGEWFSQEVESPKDRYFKVKGRTASVCNIVTRDYLEAQSNSILIADAGNTYQQCEELPSELLRQNREMKEALLLIRHSPVSNRIIETVSNCLISCNKGKE